MKKIILLLVLILITNTLAAVQLDTVIDIRDKRTGKLLEKNIKPSELKKYLDLPASDIYVEYWYKGKMIRKCWYRKEELITV